MQSLQYIVVVVVWYGDVDDCVGVEVEIFGELESFFVVVCYGDVEVELFGYMFYDFLDGVLIVSDEQLVVVVIGV